MTPAALCRPAASQLALIDAQEKLCAAMPPEAVPPLLRNLAILLQAARLLQIPMLCSEQYPQGLGPTHPELLAWLEPGSAIPKTCFSCWEAPAFRNRLPSDRPQIVLAGIEAHICVLQTALDLQAHGRQVFVVEDAVLSRNPQNKANALARLSAAGVVITNTESVVFEWLRVAEGSAFKAISRLVR